MENNLDKYFRDHLREREFPFSEEYWAGAEELLAARERRRKRRVMCWWWGGGLAAVALLVASGWFFGKKSVENPAQNASTAATGKRVGSEEGMPVFDEKNTGETRSPLAPGSRKNQAASSQSPGFAKQRKTSGTNQQSIDNQKVAAKNTLPLFSKKPKPGATLPLANVGRSGLKNAGNETAPDAEKLPQAASETEVFYRQTTPSALAVGPAFAEGDFEPKRLSVSAENQVAKPQNLHFGVMAGQLMQAGLGDGGRTLLGYRAGIVVHYDLPGNWFLSSGLQYQRRSGSFEASKIAETRRYRFGLEPDTQLLRPTSLHYLSVPVLAGYGRNRSVFEGGLVFDYLTGVRGEIGSYRKVGEPPVKEFAKEKSGWVAEDGYRRTMLTAQLRYRFRANLQLSFGLSANYTFGGILDKNHAPPVGGFLLREADKFYLGLQAAYLIK